LSGRVDSTGSGWVPWWVWAGGFVAVLLLLVLGPPAYAAKALADHLAWPFWPTYIAVLLVLYVLLPWAFSRLSASGEGRLRATKCRMCGTLPGDRATVKKSGRSLLVICPKCGEVGSLTGS